MKQLVISISLILLAFIFSTSKVFAQDFEMQLTPEQTEMMIERSIAMLKAQQKDQCKDSDIAKCLGINESKCEKISKEVMDDCAIPLLKKSMRSGKFGEEMVMELEKESAACSLKVAKKNSIDTKKYLMCVDEYDEGSHDDDSVIREMIEDS